ncbi:MAG: MBL fold metallo-hydrolase [Tissierellia bacterium]|nr:MBL fold metallo-hydrolase [Tissierellia bacterium]
MELFCYKAECGDAVRIRYVGNDDKVHNIFLDSGYERTYRSVLRQEIKDLIKKGENIDLWIISHIHDDHIGGVMKYIKSVEDKEIEDITKEWFYNPPRQYHVVSDKRKEAVSSAMSVRQGDKLYNFLSLNKKLPKKDFTIDLGTVDRFGMKIHILSPTSSIITELRDKYKTGIPFQTNEIEEISSAKAVVQNDYNKNIEEFNLDRFNEDKSLENKSSISVLVEYQGKKIMWLADSHPSVVIKSLTQKGYSVNRPLVCDYVILSHHASKGNNSSSFFSMIKCSKYIISSNSANKHSLPDKEVLAKIIRNKNRDLSLQYFLFFTYDTVGLKSVFEVDKNDVIEKWNFVPIYCNSLFLYFQL